MRAKGRWACFMSRNAYSTAIRSVPLHGRRPILGLPSGWFSKSSIQLGEASVASESQTDAGVMERLRATSVGTKSVKRLRGRVEVPLKGRRDTDSYDSSQ